MWSREQQHAKKEEIEITSFTTNNPKTPMTKNVNTFKVLSLLFASSLITLILTSIPVLISTDVPSDTMRLFEPLFTIQFSFFIFIESGFLLTPLDARKTIICIAFVFFLYLYQHGAAFHSVTIIHKRPLETFLNDHNATIDFPYQIANTTVSIPTSQLNYLGAYFYSMEFVWEHCVSHYIYAVGGCGVAFIFFLLFKDDYNEKGLDSTLERTIFVLLILIYGVTLGAVATEFPFGTTVGIIYVVFYGFGVVGLSLYWKGDAFSWGKRAILQFYFFSYCLAFVIIIGWFCYTRSLSTRNYTYPPS